MIFIFKGMGDFINYLNLIMQMHMSKKSITKSGNLKSKIINCTKENNEPVSQHIDRQDQD